MTQREDLFKNHRLDSPFHHATERFDSPLVFAAAFAVLRLDLTPCGKIQRGVKLQFKELHEFENKVEKIGYESGSKVYTFD
jgi:hypothetical protein